MAQPSNPLTSFTFAAIYVFIPSLPVTHGLGLFAHCPRAAKARHVLLYPFKGGRHHTIFQLISWVIWAASVLVAVPVLFKHDRLRVPESHTEILSAAAAVGSVFAELFMIQSLLVFDPQVKSGLADEQPSSPAYNRSAVPSKPMAGTVVVAMGALWVSMAGALVWATEFLDDVTTKQAYLGFSLACLLVGFLTTHGLGGQLWHFSAAEEETKAKAWRFYQPFRGGAAFVATQALGWLLFTASLTSVAWLLAQIAAGVAYCIRCWALGTCSVMAAAYLVLGVSIWTFRAPDFKAAEKRPGPPWSTVWLPVLALYTPAHFLCFALASTFVLLPLAHASALWIGGLILYYLLTRQGAPQHTGSREWPAVRAWLNQNLEAALRCWLGSVEVVFEDAAALKPGRQYVFGYTPHGLFPIGAPYLSLLPQFRARAPHIDLVPLIASVCFYIPVVNDLCSWCGVRQVSRPTFVRALEEGRSVMLVPGGQAELVHTWRFFSRREFVVYGRHKGFVRLAVEHGVSLVPVLCLGEIAQLRNFFDWPAMQQWTYKQLGFPIPYLVVGRWGLTPFPRSSALKFIVGAPLPTPPRKVGQPVDEAVVEDVHRRFYTAVEALYKKHQPHFPGFEGVSLVMER